MEATWKNVEGILYKIEKLKIIDYIDKITDQQGVCNVDIIMKYDAAEKDFYIADTDPDFIFNALLTLYDDLYWPSFWYEIWGGIKTIAFYFHLLTHIIEYSVIGFIFFMTFSFIQSSGQLPRVIEALKGLVK